jgi:hypothetical protein
MYFPLILAQRVDNFGNQPQPEMPMAFVCCYLVFVLAVYVTISMGFYKIFEKAGKPGWAGFVPIYNAIVLLDVVNRPIWWIVLLLIPCVSIVAWIIVSIDLAKCFNRGPGMIVGLVLLPVVFVPILGFSGDTYRPITH